MINKFLNICYAYYASKLLFQNNNKKKQCRILWVVCHFAKINVKI